MEDIIKELYDIAVHQLSNSKEGTELYGYWLGKASVLSEIKSLIE